MSIKRLPPATPETFLAMELAYGPDITADDITAFLKITREEALDDKLEVVPPLMVWLQAYQAFKHPHEAAALEDEHLQAPAKYNPLR